MIMKWMNKLEKNLCIDALSLDSQIAMAPTEVSALLGQ
jgi:hypothetical protein